MSMFHEMFESSLIEVLSDEDFEGLPDELEAKVALMIPDLADSVADSMLSAIKKDAPCGLVANWEHRRQFEERLRTHWQEPLELLDLFISLALEAGKEFNREFRGVAVSSNDAVFEALTRFSKLRHVPYSRRSPDCTLERVRLRQLFLCYSSGYADDAHARWRALHEISVMSHFIGEEGQEVAERYLLHNTIQRYKLALKLQRHAATIGTEPLSQKEFDKLKTERDLLVERYGKPFGKDYGWAASAIGNDRPTIGDIEKCVDLEHWRPYYGMASDNVHANAHGGYFRLGLATPQIDKVLLAGPSNVGLADPGHATAISLCQVTTVLLTSEPNFDSIVIPKILLKLEEEIGEAFLQAHRELEELENDVSEPM